MQTSSADRKRLTPAQREKTLSAYRQSGLCQRAFATQAGIGLSTLQLWLRNSAASVPSTAGFVQIPNLLAQPAAPPVYRLHLKNGVIVEIGSGFQREEVAALLQLLPA